MLTAGTVAAAATQKVLTVEAVSRTAARASRPPSGAPMMQPTTARLTASPRKSHRIVERAVPTVRSIPISARRVITDTVTAL